MASKHITAKAKAEAQKRAKATPPKPQVETVPFPNPKDILTDEKVQECNSEPCDCCIGSPKRIPIIPSLHTVVDTIEHYEQMTADADEQVKQLRSHHSHLVAERNRLSDAIAQVETDLAAAGKVKSFYANQLRHHQHTLRSIIDDK